MSQQGLKKNIKQFMLLVIVNGFVGGMVGLERSIIPRLASESFQVNATTALLSFIVSFGISKAIANYYTGKLADRWGRRNLLIAGWIIGLPVPMIIIGADVWSMITLANILLGINQGLTWSSTVVMKIDLVGPKNRGLAMGINESAGYLAVGATAFFTSWLAAEYGVRPVPFYLGIAYALSGLILTVLWVKDTADYVKMEGQKSTAITHEKVFYKTTISDPDLSSITQAGMINNLNDGMLWGLLPMLLMNYGFDIINSGKLIAIYPLVWGLGQILTGPLSDRFKIKPILFWGMLLQAISIFGIVYSHNFIGQVIAGVGMGVGTALVYPTFLAALSKYTHPEQRAEVIGVFRFWRDSGYAIGALLTGILSDFFGLQTSILIVGCLTLLSALIVRMRME